MSCFSWFEALLISVPLNIGTIVWAGSCMKDKAFVVFVGFILPYSKSCLIGLKKKKFSAKLIDSCSFTVVYILRFRNCLLKRTVFCDVSSWPNMGPLNLTISMKEQEKPTSLLHYWLAWLRQSWPILERARYYSNAMTRSARWGWGVGGGVARRAWDTARHDAKAPGAFLQICQTYGKKKKKKLRASGVAF